MIWLDTLIGRLRATLAGWWECGCVDCRARDDEHVAAHFEAQDERQGWCMDCGCGRCLDRKARFWDQQEVGL